MNKTFRSVWNASKQAYVAAAETISAKGKPSSGVKIAAVISALFGGLLSLSAHAQNAPPPNTLPTGGQVSAGQANISQSGANMVIQQGSDRAAINWQTFNVGSNAQVQFNQPSAASVTLNRVMSSDPSQIFGRISANGQVILTNPSGVYFGKDSRVDVGGLIATTHSISDADFMAGKSRFERNGSTGSVVNEGELKAALGGYIALLAPEVRNQGAIIAQMGTVALAAGEAIDLKFDTNNRLTSIRVEPSQIQALVDNQYAVQAPGGLIILAAQAMDRLVGGVVKHSGTLQASSMTEKGGRIVLEGDNITLQAGSKIEANGKTGGGEVLVGGDWQGSGDMHQATTVIMEAGVTIDASATQQGDGGKVVLWSDVQKTDSLTTAQGTVLAKGGAQGGNGGQVETSGHSINIDHFKVDTRSASDALGKTGLWLIDPYDYNIGSSQASAIGTALNTSDVTVTTSSNNTTYGSNGNVASGGSITVSNPITKTGTGPTTLTLKAEQRVIVNSDITSTAGPLNVVLWANTTDTSSGTANNGIALRHGVSISTSGGDIVLGGGLDTDSNGRPDGYAYSGANSAAAGGVSLGTIDVLDQALVTLNSGGGDITIRGATGGNPNISSTSGIQTQAQLLIDSGMGTIVMDGISATTHGVYIGDGSASMSVAIRSRSNAATAISITGNTTHTGSVGIFSWDRNNANTQISSLLIQSEGSGGIAITGDTTTGAEGVVLYTGGQVLAASGAITVKGNGSYDDIKFDGMAFGRRQDATAVQGITPLNASSSNILLRGDSYDFKAGVTSYFNTSGTVTIEPKANDFSATFSSTGLGFSSDVSGLTIGKSATSANGTSDANVSLGSTISIAGPISIYGRDIAINNPLTATNNNINLTASGTVTQGSALTANGLTLLGTGTFTLTNTSNNIGTLAASGVSGLTYVDSNALTIGTITPTTGITATGAVNISTLSGDLTVSNNISTTNGSTSAIVLNADKNANIASAASSAGGNILLGNGVTLTADSDNNDTAERITLYTGSLNGSTGVSALVGSGSGHFRYGSDETTARYTTALGAGSYAIYREQPTASVTVGSQTITYGAAVPTITGITTGILNGDTPSYGVSAVAYSTANKIKAGSYTLTETGLAAQGYNVSGSSNGTLTVNRLALTGSIAAGSSTYGSALNAGTASFTNAISGDQLGSATVSIATTGNTSSSGHLKAGSYSGIQSVTALSGTDGGNYTFANVAGNYSVSQLALTLSGFTAADKVYDRSTAASITNAGTLSGLITGDTVDVGNTSATFANWNVGTNKTVTLNGVTLSNTDAANYSIASTATDTANITAKALTLSGLTSANKVYDGTTVASVNGTAALQSAITAGSGTSSDGKAYTGDTVSLTGGPAGNFNSKDVASATTVSFSGLSLSGADAGNYSLTAHPTASHTIGRATLIATANNDAKFVAQADPSFGVSVSGFVNGETTGTAAGYAAPTVARSGSDSAAGTYNGVLMASGGSAVNYSFNPVAGNFTIVGSDQLLVRVSNASSTYGAATQYTLTSAQYEHGGTVYTLGSGGVSGSSVSITASNLVSVNDGASGTASFTLAPLSPTTSTANKLAVGSYQLGTSGTITENSANFGNTITVVGAHQVNTKGLTATASGVSKAYDGNTSMSGVTLGLTTIEANDQVSVNGAGAFSNKNAGTSLGYTISNLTLSGADAANYYLTSGANLTGNDGVITQRTVTLTAPTASRVYDGHTTYVASAADLAALSAALGVTGDTVSSISLSYDNKNVGTGKTLTASGATVADGNNGGNYTLSYATNTQSSITRLNSVTWIGGTSGNWFDPANWAGGAVPDLSNVANVVIPNGVTVSFNSTVVAPAESGPVNIDGLTGSGGNLSQSTGTLNVGIGGITLGSLTQSGGTLTNAGSTTLDSYAIAGDASKSASEAQEKVQGSQPVSTLPGATGPSTTTPQRLVLTQNSVNAASTESSTSANQASAGTATSSGVTIDLTSTPVATALIMAAVSLPKDTAIAGTGFSFELSESIRVMNTNGGKPQASMPDGSLLPAWLKFDAQTLRFEATVVPDGEFPLQVIIRMGGQRVLMVISERTE